MPSRIMVLFYFIFFRTMALNTNYMQSILLSEKRKYKGVCVMYLYIYICILKGNKLKEYKLFVCMCLQYL